MVLDFVRTIREEDPGIGGRKLWLMGKDVMEGIMMGRDAFYSLLDKVVGRCLSPTLEAKYTLDALRQAISQADGCDLSKLTHHSDRGVQYCCNLYVDELNKYSVKISMTEDYKPTDNGIAERVNGIIKTEKLYLIPPLKNIEEAQREISAFISFYNEKRPHMSIGYKTPSEVHIQKGEQVKAWRGWQWTRNHLSTLTTKTGICQH